MSPRVGTCAPLPLRPASCHSARPFITEVTWPEPGIRWLPVTDTSSDLQAVPAPLYPAHKQTHEERSRHTFCCLSLEERGKTSDFLNILFSSFLIAVMWSKVTQNVIIEIYQHTSPADAILVYSFV